MIIITSTILTYQVIIFVSRNTEVQLPAAAAGWKTAAADEDADRGHFAACPPPAGKRDAWNELPAEGGYESDDGRAAVRASKVHLKQCSTS